MLVTGLFLLAAAFSSGFAKEYPCLQGPACSGNGRHDVTINGATLCCRSAQHSLNLTDTTCTCTESPGADFDCLQAIRGECQGATSFTTDSKGNTRCCPLNHHMTNLMSTDAQGQLSEVCKCKPSSLGGGSILSSVLGINNNNKGQNGSGTSGFNTDQWRQLGAQWKQWGQNFARGFGAWGRNLGEQMRSTGQELARGLSTPVQSAIRGFLGNIFGSSPMAGSG